MARPLLKVDAMNNDPKKTQLGWTPTPELQQQLRAPYQPQPQEQQQLYPQQHHAQQYAAQHPFEAYAPQYAPQPEVQHQYQAHYPAQGSAPYAPQPGGQYAAYPQYASQSQASYPPAAAYNYQRDAAAIAQQMHQHRAIPHANATQGASDRVRFIRLTYLHLLGAILAFAGLLWMFMNVPFLVEKVSIPLIKFALGGRWNWSVVLAVFMVVSWVADYWASHTTSRPMQYVGLAFYVVAEALIFVPLLAIVAWKTQAIIAKGGGDPNIIRDAAYVTLGIFAALTASVFITKKDFSFLRSGLIMASGAALMLIVLSLAFGFNLGLVFSIAMVLLAAAYILYQTSQVLAHYDPNQYVAASLALFSSVALMFWYVIRIFLKMRSN